MAIDFPNDGLVDGQQYTDGATGKTWTWDESQATWISAYGYQGFQGSQGSQGHQGSQGSQGSQGNQGFQGSQGFQGNQGSQGSQGFQGNQGSQGFQGSQGSQGRQGSQGSQGFQGNQGSQGSQGAPSTIQGPQGSQGFQGRQGSQGSQGATGAQGNQGSQGATGAQGNQGSQGFQGRQGSQGFQGRQGSQGATGAQGNQGSQGRQGSQGATGAQGNQGSQGAAGPSDVIRVSATGDTTSYPVLVGGSAGSPTNYTPLVGNLFTFDETNGYMTCNRHVTSGGTSSQFVKGDGTLDSTSYWSSHANTSALNGTYGSTSNNTKIDQITVDADGHVTAITTGTTGDILGVTASTGLSGGGTSGTVSLSVAAAQTSITSMYNTTLQVGYSSTTAFIDFNSTAMDFEWSSAPEFRMTSGGVFHADGEITAYSTTTTSDRRYKKDILIMEDALERVKQLNGVTFKWKRDDRVGAGLIAQDVEKVLPQAVKETENIKEEGETFKALSYDGVVGLLVEAVKELSARVEELENGN